MSACHIHLRQPMHSLLQHIPMHFTCWLCFTPVGRFCMSLASRVVLLQTTIVSLHPPDLPSKSEVSARATLLPQPAVTTHFKDFESSTSLHHKFLNQGPSLLLVLLPSMFSVKIQKLQLNSAGYYFSRAENSLLCHRAKHSLIIIMLRLMTSP